MMVVVIVGLTTDCGVRPRFVMLRRRTIHTDHYHVKCHHALASSVTVYNVQPRPRCKFNWLAGRYFELAFRAAFVSVKADGTHWSVHSQAELCLTWIIISCLRSLKTSSFLSISTSPPLASLLTLTTTFHNRSSRVETRLPCVVEIASYRLIFIRHRPLNHAWACIRDWRTGLSGG